MSIYRVTNNVLSNQSLYYLGQNMSNLSTLQQRLSSQQNINKPSDDRAKVLGPAFTRSGATSLQRRPRSSCSGTAGLSSGRVVSP